MSLIGKAGFSLVALAFASFASHELIRLCRFGHFFPLGQHVEVVVTSSNDLLGVEGTGKIHNASLTNQGVLPAAVTVCDYLDWTSRHQTKVLSGGCITSSCHAVEPVECVRREECHLLHQQQVQASATPRLREAPSVFVVRQTGGPRSQVSPSLIQREVLRRCRPARRGLPGSLTPRSLP